MLLGVAAFLPLLVFSAADRLLVVPVVTLTVVIMPLALGVGLGSGLATATMLALGFSDMWQIAGTSSTLVAWHMLCVTAGLALQRKPVLQVCAVALLAGWLLWPIWLAPALSEHGLTTAPGPSTTWHPLFAVDRADSPNSVWTERPLGYRLTPLGQDLAYIRPASPWPAIVVHSGCAFVLAVVAWRKRRVAER